MTRDHLDPGDLLDGPAPTLLTVLISYLVDDVTGPQETRTEAAARVYQTLDGGGDTPDVGTVTLPARARVNPDTWGLEPEHQAGLARAVGLGLDTGASLDDAVTLAPALGVPAPVIDVPLAGDDR